MTMLTINDIQFPPPKSWDTLEAMLRDLLRAEWQDFHAQRYGRRGQSQQGVDVFGRPIATPGWAGVQCKNKDLRLRARLTVKELRQEVHKAKSFVPPLTQFIIATTAPRDARIQEEARRITDRHQKSGLFSVHVYAWDDVQDLMTRHEPVARRYYSNFWPQSIADGPLLLKTKVSAAFAAPPMPVDTHTPQEAAVHVLSAPAAQALGILATSPLPFPEDVYPMLFPRTDWEAVLPELTTAKAVTRADAVIGVSETMKSRFLPTDADKNEFLDTWIAALEPLAHHIDMAIFLALQYLARGNPLRAVDVVVVLARKLERGIWNNIYATVLGVFDKPEILRRLTSQQRRVFLSAYGGCLARADRPADALPCARRLLAASKRAHDHEGIAQALLLFGLAHQYLGEADQAAAYYERTAAYGKKQGVALLVGHALHNLAMLKVETDPAEADRLLELSITAKKRAKDEPGRVGALFGRGCLAASRGQYADAFKWYSRAERLAHKWDIQHARALALCNMGTALVDQGNPRAAIKHYHTAEAVAYHEGYPDALSLAVGGAAKVYLAMNGFAKAEERFRRLRELEEDAGDHERAVVALHDVGVCLLKQGKFEESRQVLASAYAEAIEHSLSDWIYRCAKDIAFTHLTTDGPNRTVSELRKAAKQQASEGRHEVSAQLWESIASVLAEHAPGSPDIDQAFLNAIAAAEPGGRPLAERFRLLSGLFQHRWDSSRFESAMTALRTGLHLAKESRNDEYRCRFADQLGMCLQQLGNPEAAIPEHRNALRVARSLPDTGLAENCLNNLGEALRKTRRSDEAIPLFREAEALARDRGDVESEISLAHNRALALEDVGKRAQATAVLRKCRDVSLELECWDQYVRALHGLANRAWIASKVDEAQDLYRQALSAAKKHRVPEQAVAISINYANALRYKNRPERACKVLLAVRSNVSATPNAHEYHFVLGAAAEEASNFATAIAAYEAAFTGARAAGAAVEAAQAATSLAECHLNAGNYDQAGDVLHRALSAETVTKRKVPLLTVRLKLLLQTGPRSQASRVFGQATRLAKAEGMKEELVDLYMLIGDHDWDHGKSKTNAMKAYTGALLPAGELGVEVMIETGMHSVRRLLTLPGTDRVQQIEKLLASLQTWLKIQVKENEYADVERIALWPPRVALRLAREGSSLLTLSESELTQQLRHEILGEA
jgi:tetratricopeptide (TPR) repeat protein